MAKKASVFTNTSPVSKTCLYKRILIENSNEDTKVSEDIDYQTENNKLAMEKAILEKRHSIVQGKKAFREALLSTQFSPLTVLTAKENIEVLEMKLEALEKLYKEYFL